MVMTHRIILVTGPTRSGKSEWAEHLAHGCDYPVTYLATSTAATDDEEWQQRIKDHRLRRPPQWQTLEVGADLARTIALTLPGNCLLVDSLGSWLTTVLTQDSPRWEYTVDELLDTLKLTPNPVILVSEETGWGIVPAYATGRLFRDRLGTLTRQIGAMADVVYLVTSGYAINLKQVGELIQ
jgi:adenosylcobinamide kinase/adenosylcobinamide-phosphate guanylyltransferase